LFEQHAGPVAPSPTSLAASGPLVEALHARWLQDPGSVDRDWGIFFEGFDLASCPRTCMAAEQARAQTRVSSLMYAYRSQGHLAARIDPLGNNPDHHASLSLEAFGLEEEHLDRVFDTGHLGGPERAPLRDIIAILKETYCGPIGVEYVHIQDKHIRRWLQAEMEPVRNQPRYGADRRRDILECLIDAEVFETFLQSRYPGQKRFSLEGAESLIPALHELVKDAPGLGIEEMVLGMAHRGRLNVLANILDKSYRQIFSEFEDNFFPGTVGGDGDVKYHRGFSSDHVGPDGRSLHLSLTANPSHLEAVDPLVLGRARAKQRLRGGADSRSRVLPMLIHGDAAFAGQGLVAETLNLSQLEGYHVGGTIHFIVNNQIGFTTLPSEARSTLYSTDVAKMIEAPIFHVNGDDPEAVVFVTLLALRFRQRFARDVVVDMICYRRHGHNETDEPAFTQPLLYSKIKGRPSVRTLYTESLAREKALTAREADEMALAFRDRLNRALRGAKGGSTVALHSAFEAHWKNFDNPYSYRGEDTSVSRETLQEVTRALTTVPEGFSLNPKVARRLPVLRQNVEERGIVDWAAAESLAFGSLLREGIPVRLSGQDSARGTFSQRHAVWQDMKTQESYYPLLHIHPDQARFCVYNSMLSEAAVLGFDYGYSLVEPRMLVLWEAQFGDFSNGAQVIIDQFIVSSQSKWQRTSGLVLLLPHGYEGQGPEHSNAYLERYLAACAEDNIQVCNLTSPAQYFHALRRQIKRSFRRPLVIMAPKSMLRHPKAVSPVRDLESGAFLEILDDERPNPDAARLILCSGKIYYNLNNAREELDAGDAALVRVEQFYPFHEELLREVADRYGRIEEVVWAQEEPRNRGGWSFMEPRLRTLFPETPIRYAGRPASASPAVGSLGVHLREQETLVRDALGLKAGGEAVR